MKMRFVFWFIILLLFQTCAPPKVIKFINDELDYSKYHSYRLIHYKSDDKSYDQEGLAFYNEVEKAIDLNMIAKNYVQAESSDLLARYEIVSTTVTESNNNNYDPYGYNTYYTPRNDQKHTEGIVLIELRDRKQKKLVWQGSLDLKYSKRKSASITILESINRIFETYPYKAGSNDKVNSTQ